MIKPGQVGRAARICSSKLCTSLSVFVSSTISLNLRWLCCIIATSITLSEQSNQWRRRRQPGLSGQTPTPSARQTQLTPADDGPCSIMDPRRATLAPDSGTVWRHYRMRNCCRQFRSIRRVRSFKSESKELELRASLFGSRQLTTPRL